MASTPQVSLPFLFFFAVFLVLMAVTAGESNPGNTEEKQQPQWLGQFDGTVLVPGLGRYMVPKKGQMPFQYNPITGVPTGGHGISSPDVGTSAPRRYIPGGDDTLLPNPGTEVPIPSGGNVPVPSQP